MTFYSRLVAHLEQGLSARGLELEEFEDPLMAEMQLLTSKPILYVCNVDESSVVSGNGHVDRVKEVAQQEGAGVLVLGAAIEADESSSLAMTQAINAAVQPVLDARNMGQSAAWWGSLFRLVKQRTGIDMNRQTVPLRTRCWTHHWWVAR